MHSNNANWGRWLLNPKYSDWKIKCGDQTYSAHRLVVCSNSAYFATICDGGFKVRPTRCLLLLVNLEILEAVTQEIPLNEHTPLEVMKMLQYLYMEDYALEDQDVAAYLQYLFSTEFLADSRQSTDHREGLSNDKGQDCLARFHARMYSVGDYFQIPGLKATAQRYFRAAFESIQSRYAFYVTVEAVYSSTPVSDRGLRDMVVDLVLEEPQWVRYGEEPMLYDGLLRDVPEFAIDLCLESVETLR